MTIRLGVAFSASLAWAVAVAQPVAAQEGLSYEPTIWIDPDGCEHWVMDDGFEGFMSPHRNRDGTPVCHRSEICGIVPTDVLFATDSSRMSGAARQQLADFFRGADAFGFIIQGHTDSRASDEYNMRLSQRRADSVADVARDAGLRVVDARGFGERMPRSDSLAENRRVEIYCLK